MKDIIREKSTEVLEAEKKSLEFVFNNLEKCTQPAMKLIDNCVYLDYVELELLKRKVNHG